MKRSLLLVTSAASILVFTACASTPTPTPRPTPTPVPAQRDPLSLAEAYYEAYNVGDIETLASIFADNVVLDFEPSGPPPITGKLAVLREQAGEVSSDPQISFANPSVEGNTFTADHSFQGVPRDQRHHFTGTMEIVVEAGKITSITVTLDEETLKKIQ